MDIDLPLFRWVPPHKVIAFPLARRIGKIRHVAEILASKQGNAAVTYWRQIVVTIAGQMERSGLAPDIVEAELRSFHNEVQREMQRRAWTGHGRRPGGDAA